MLSRLTSQESEGEPQGGEGNKVVWLVGAERARMSTNGSLFNSTETPAVASQHNTLRPDVSDEDGDTRDFR